MTIGEWGWLGLLLYIVLVDSHAWRCENETMSVAFGRRLQSPQGKLWCAAVWGGLTAHLWWSMPIPGQTHLKRFVTKRGQTPIEFVEPIIVNIVVPVIPDP